MPVVPMTMVAPISVAVRIIVVIVTAIVVGIVAPVVYWIRVAISGSDRYTKVTASLRFLRSKGYEPKGEQKYKKIFFHKTNRLLL
jgi:hypothetical protein